MTALCPHCRSPLGPAGPNSSGPVLCERCHGAVPSDLDRTVDLQPATPIPGDAKPPTAAGPRFGPYQALGPLGAGGMGSVHRARDPRLGRDVAVKVLPERFTDDPAALERLRREARTASALNHPHIATVHDLGEDAGRPFVVMELVEGRNFAEVIAGGADPGAAVRLGRQVAEALAAAHAAGVVHRDIKPSNLMVRVDGYAKVLDFGLARPVQVAAEAEGGRAAEAADADPGLTAEGAVLGTPRYMAPEQARGEPATPAADVFSLGLVLYELATGRHPFNAGSTAAALRAVLAESIPPPTQFNPDLPAGLGALIVRMLTRDHRLRPSAAEVAAALGTNDPRPPRGFDRCLIGRQAELSELLGALEEAGAGRGAMIGIAGEAGIGKTALVECFLTGIRAGPRAPLVARGGCSERLAGAEAYQPILEALGGLLRETDGGATADVMRNTAPTWYVQVVPLSDDSAARLAERTRSSSQERLNREFVALVQELARGRPVVVFLDDLHWSDVSTADLLAYLGGRIGRLPVLVLVTFRPSDLALGEHPFVHVKQELQGKRAFHELALPFLGRAAIERYLAEAFPEHHFPADFVDLIGRKTEGSPLFLVNLLADLRDRGVLAQAEGRWSLVGSVADLARGLPESLRALIQRKIDRLDESDRRLLVAASVQGAEFDAAVVARALGAGAGDVEERLEVLDRSHGLVRELGECELHDRTLTLRYGFVHVLYQNALYATLKPTRRAALSRAVAEALLAAHGDRSPAVAVELALLFEAARDYPRAANHFRRAAQNAVSVFANREAVALARRGLGLLGKAPDSPERTRRELDLLITLGPPLFASGAGTAEFEKTYTRAHDLCRQLGEAPLLFPALWGLWIFATIRSEIPTAKRLGQQLLDLAREANDPALLVQAHHALGPTHYFAGEWADAVVHFDQGVALYRPGEHHAQAMHLYGGHDPCVCCQCMAANCLWMLGYPDRAARRNQESLTLARELGHPASLGHVWLFTGVLHQLRRDVAETRTVAETLRDVAAEQGLEWYLAMALVLRGWALGEQGHGGEGSAQVRQGLTMLRAGATAWCAYAQTLLAEAYGRERRFAEGIAELEEALRTAGERGTGLYEPEMHRLKGEYLLALTPGGAADVESCFRRAIEIARRQGARALELRAVASLCHLHQAQGGAAEARQMLAATYGRFTEGFDTADLRDVRELLRAVS